MIDVAKLKSGVRVKMKDGQVGTIRGSYMSVDGIVLTVKTNAQGIVDRNVPLGDVAEIVDAG